MKAIHNKGVESIGKSFVVYDPAKLVKMKAIHNALRSRSLGGTVVYDPAKLVKMKAIHNTPGFLPSARGGFLWYLVIISIFSSIFFNFYLVIKKLFVYLQRSRLLRFLVLHCQAIYLFGRFYIYN